MEEGSSLTAVEVWENGELSCSEVSLGESLFMYKGCASREIVPTASGGTLGVLTKIVASVFR